MKQKDLPLRWHTRIAQFLNATGSKFKEFAADPFQFDLEIEFSDGSKAYFNYAFYLIDTEMEELAVFTEHCGYHIFPLLSLRFKIIARRNREVIRTKDFTID